ncbi:MAG: Glycerol-3-phosphate (1)-acyltransferase [Lasallia pustulata]|uniref:Tafazzin family protein n=1 Tax=Lasallia pustulata TaxID=136370 RepID=A0A5M8PP52_9LECA|nr:MAG: Glycerol-3-phosphate (1)-acyltransferase [Lasallia pustulata]
MGLVGSISRIFMFGANRTEVHGLDQFLELLDERRDIDGRERGLLTVSNHISVVDDPMVWGALPFRHQFNPNNHRWSFGSYDICFTNKFESTFFTLGQVLPTHRNAHSAHGGIFQPTLTQAVRLLSRPPFSRPFPHQSTASNRPDRSPSSPDITDPFSSPHLTYSTNGIDTFPAPSSYAARRYAWLHIFPEGRVHQHSHKTMRYFKWGVARLILEPDVCPDIVPMWIEGNDEVMHESREWPRFVPRVGKSLGIWFGDPIGGDKDTVFADLRSKWRELVAKKGNAIDEMGVLESEELRTGREAEALRAECTRRMRNAVLRVRRARGLPDEDPKDGLVETWREEKGKGEGKMEDGSWEKDT